MIADYNKEKSSKNNDKICITIFENRISFFVRFSMKCYRILIDEYEKTCNHRLSFIKAVYYMYQKNTEDIMSPISEDMFANIADEDLRRILELVLKYNHNIKLEYDQIKDDDNYKRFYLAHEKALVKTMETVSKQFSSAINNMNEVNLGISEELKNISNSIQCINPDVFGKCKQGLTEAFGYNNPFVFTNKFGNIYGLSN